MNKKFLIGIAVLIIIGATWFFTKNPQQRTDLPDQYIANRYLDWNIIENKQDVIPWSDWKYFESIGQADEQSVSGPRFDKIIRQPTLIHFYDEGDFYINLNTKTLVLNASLGYSATGNSTKDFLDLIFDDNGQKGSLSIDKVGQLTIIITSPVKPTPIPEKIGYSSKTVDGWTLYVPLTDQVATPMDFGIESSQHYTFTSDSAAIRIFDSLVVDNPIDNVLIDPNDKRIVFLVKPDGYTFEQSGPQETLSWSLWSHKTNGYLEGDFVTAGYGDFIMLFALFDNETATPQPSATLTPTAGATATP